MRNRTPAWLRAALLVSATLLRLGLPAGSDAQVNPGDLITAANALKVRGLVAPGVYRQIAEGMAIKIVSTEQIDLPPPFKEATDSYARRVALSADHRSLDGYVAGLPFPAIDANDPYVAIKIMWNSQFRPVFSDDYDLRFAECEFSYPAGKKPGEAFDAVQFGHYAGYNLVGRTEVQPLPVDPEFQTSRRYWLFALYPVLAPAEIRGGGFLRHRFADPDKPDELWAYNPTGRRLRRLSEEMVSSPTGIGGWSPDHYAGFNAKVENFDYRFLGQKTMLASVHAVHSPAPRCAPGAVGCAENWELRSLYIVEAIPRRQAVLESGSKAVVYIDSQGWFAPYLDIYNRAGELDQSSVYLWSYRDRAMPDASVAIYPFKREFIVAAQAFNLHEGLATKCYLPGSQTQEHEGWYINMGAVDQSFFTTKAMSKAAP